MRAVGGNNYKLPHMKKEHNRRIGNLIQNIEFDDYKYKSALELVRRRVVDVHECSLGNCSIILERRSSS